jgi:ATP-dependent helicase/nuclease subunit A
VALPKQDTGGLDWVAGPAGEVPFWSPRKEMCGPVAVAAREAKRARDMQEYNRLLYVALTRAEDRLLVCGWPGRRAPDRASWYAIVERAMQGLGAASDAFEPWLGEQLFLETAQTVPPLPTPVTVARGVVPIPGWAGRAPEWRAAALPEEPAVPRPLAPSRPEGVELGPVPPALSPLAGAPGRAAGLRRGTLVHALLQHLPGLPAARREAAALAYARRAAPDVAEAAAEEVLAVLGHAALAPLFAPGSRAEVPLTGVIGEHVIGGLIDRLAVRDSDVLLADFKTDRAPPADAASVPVRYLRQMAAYRAVLRAIYPDREVRCLLAYTRGPVVLALPDALLDCHAPGTSLPRDAVAPV